MKKLVLACMALLLLVGMVGCQSAPKNEETSALDIATFAKKLGETEDGKVRVYFQVEEVVEGENVMVETDTTLATSEEMSAELAAALREKATEFFNNVVVTEAQDQTRGGGPALFFVELNKLTDENYIRFTVLLDGDIMISDANNHVMFEADEANTTLINDTVNALHSAVSAK